MDKLSKKNAKVSRRQGTNELKLFCFPAIELRGSIDVPPSKSYLHRYLIAATLAQSPLILTHVCELATDIQVTLHALSAFGLTFAHDGQKGHLYLNLNEQLQARNVSLNMGESGSSLRLLLPLLLHFFDDVELTGENKLPMRPLKPYFEAFKAANFIRTTKHNLPLQMRGEIKPEPYVFKEQMSSQFISGLLFVLPLLDSGSTIELTHTPLSLPYIQMTIAVLRQFGVAIQHNNSYTFFAIHAPQRYVAPKTRTIAIEQDYSARAFWDVAYAIKHDALAIKPTAASTLQGDARLAHIIRSGQRTIDIADTPDLAPIVALYLSQTTGGSLINTNVLIHKESNRLQAIIDFLTRANISYIQETNKLHIGKGKVRGGTYNTYNDHRITMMLIIAASVATHPICLCEVGSITKSYPSFLTHYKNVGGIINEQ
jgi:3-phosphoshikimate 1-carboxyvinyltransferase